jgi:stage V sporulation protein B
MTILSFGVILDIILSVYLIPIYGINGAAAATAITGFLIMTSIVWKTLQIADVKLQYKDLGRIVLAAGIMGAVLLLIPQNLLISSVNLSSLSFNYIDFFSKYIIFALVVILAAIVYVAALILVGGIKKSDISALGKLVNKAGPLKVAFEKLVSLIERFAR